MGRKPNQLILEFFERGPKLEDASNRYQHTCKSCGEKFPKGRIDSLTNHLIKKCPALPLRDRQRAVLQYHDLPADLSGDLTAQMAARQGQNQYGQAMKLPFAPKEGMSALETLAEVSRQHLDLSGKRVGGDQGRTTPPPHTTASNQGAFMDEFLIHDDRPDGHDMSGVSHSMETSSTPALPSLYQFHGPLQHSPISSPHLTSLPMTTSGSMHQMMPSLVMTASAATELSNIMPLGNGLMEPDLNLSHTGASDKFFHTQERQQWPNMPQSSIDPLLNDNHRDQMTFKDGGLQKNTSPPRPLAMNPGGSQAHFTTDFSVNQKPTKPKVRGRFSDTRRKEVQEIRKRGACIRCRMLKKPCSGDSPCNTCQNVESARLWKQPCIRTRIADEFNLYSAGLHGILAFQAISSAKSQVRLDQIPGRIEASHYPDSGTFVTFQPLKGPVPMSGSDIDPVILASLSQPGLEIIDNEEDIGGKLELYIKKMAPSFLEKEDSAFMKTTLRIANSIVTSDHTLLPRVIELWNLTRILTSRDSDWHLFSNPSLPPAIVPSTMLPVDLENTARHPLTPSNNAHSYNLVRMQLQGATEKRAACLARVIMNDLERRLLQRQQANPFETFLVAVILLACVERMCWLFRTWEEEPSPLPPTAADPAITAAATAAANDAAHRGEFPPSEHEHAHEQTDASLAQALKTASETHNQSAAPSAEDHHQQQPQQQSEQPQQPQQPQYPGSCSRNPKWPFDKPAAYYSQQGERFSDILNMLLKMRGVPPKPVARNSDGMLIMWGDDVDATVREWYEGIQVTVSGLVERSQARFEGVDPREWEGKFVGKIVGVS